MKKAVYILVIFLVFFYSDGYSHYKKVKYESSSDTISVDSIEYELIIIDPGFETWLFTKPSKEFYSNGFYRYMNRLYVTEWNYRYTTNKNRGEYDSYIDYNPDIDYGLALNYKLYYYFKYFEEKHNTRLYPTFR